MGKRKRSKTKKPSKANRSKREMGSSIYGMEELEFQAAPETRTFDGEGNNLQNPTWGKSNEPLRRFPTSPNYADGVSKLRKGPNPRKISNIVCVEDVPSEPHPHLSSFMWVWGQFLDHEIDLSTESEDEPLDFNSPPDDPVVANATIKFHRSNAAPGTGASGVAREQVNVLAAYVDGANVYGASLQRALALRTLDGTGRLKVSSGKHGDLLPFNTAGIANAQGPLRNRDRPDRFFLAGDVRCNEHNVLTCMHTLFVREHNRFCDEIADRPSASLRREIKAIGQDEAIFQRARRHVVAIEQVITYEEFLPELLGKKWIKPYMTRGKGSYDEKADATIANVFSTAAYRLGHDMLNSRIPLASLWDDRVKSLSLDQAFWKPERVKKLGIDVFLAGIAQTNMEQLNCQTTEAVRSNLFNVHPKMPRMLLDLAALNIQRGRDHGLPDYNSCRQAYGLKKVKRFEDITKNEERARRLKEAYKNVNEIDLWIGGLCEDPYRDAIVGRMFFEILSDQFTRMRNGDRFWYEIEPGLSKAEVRKLKKTKLSDVIKRNTLIDKLQENVFRT